MDDHERDVEQMGNNGKVDGVMSGLGSRSGSELESGRLKEPLLVKNNRMNNTSQLAIVGAKVCPIESLDYEYLPPSFFFTLFHIYATLSS